MKKKKNSSKKVKKQDNKSLSKSAMSAIESSMQSILERHQNKDLVPEALIKMLKKSLKDAKREKDLLQPDLSELVRFLEEMRKGQIPWPPGSIPPTPPIPWPIPRPRPWPDPIPYNQMRTVAITSNELQLIKQLRNR